MPLHSSAEDPKLRTRWRRLLRPNWEQRKKLIYIEAWCVIAVSYLVIGFAFLFPQDFRNSSQVYVAAAWLSFLCRTFLFHLGLLFIPVGIVAAWRRCWRMLFTVVVLLLITTGPSVWSFRPRSKVHSQGEAISVMTVNLLMVNRKTKPIIDEIQQATPDVLMLQEYTEHWHDALQHSIGQRFPYSVFVEREDLFGAAIYSRLPFVDSETTFVQLGDMEEPQFRTVIQIQGRDVALYNVHLLPPRRLRYVTEGRAQFADLIDHLRNEELPTIIAGDFNFTESSPQAERMGNAGLTDAYSVGGWGRGATWPVLGHLRWIPGIRLDHVYLSRELTCIQSRTGVGRGSDHRPILAKIAFQAERKQP